MSRTFILFFVIFSLCLSVSAQVAPEAQTLVPGQWVEREIAGGESHSYQISLAAGQFMRVVVEQRGIDVKLALAAPDGKQLTEFNFTRSGMESLSAEASASGDYRLTVRPSGTGTDPGSYRVRLDIKAAATAQDRERVSAERLFDDLKKGYAQGAKAETTIDKGRQVLTVWRDLGDRYWESVTFQYIGLAYVSAGKYEQAIEAFNQSLGIRRELKDRTGEAAVLSNLGDCYWGSGRYEKAVEYFEQASLIYREVKDRPYEENALYNLGTVYINLNRSEKAIEYLERALAICRELKDRAKEATRLLKLAQANVNVGRYEQAIAYLEPALLIDRGVKNRVGEAQALSTLGSAYFDLGRSEKAIECYEQALAIAREIKDRAVEGTTLRQLAYAHLTLSRNEKAIEYVEQALASHREVKDRQGEAYDLAVLGQAYRKLGRYEKGIGYYEQELALSREIKDRPGEGDALERLGVAYKELGRPEKAIEYLEQARAVHREVRNRIDEAAALNELGLAYSNLGRYEKAIEYHEQALAIYREAKFRLNEGAALGNLGETYGKLGRYEKAIEYHEQALAIAREVKYRYNEESDLDSLGETYSKLGRHEKAVGYFQQALAITREIGARNEESKALYGLAASERAQGNIPAARTHIEQSLTIAESLRADEISSPELRSSFLASVQSSYQLYTDLLMRQHKAEPAKGFDALAVETSERQRARSLLDLLTEAHADVRQGVDTALLERERSLGKQLNDKAQQLAQATKPVQAAALKQEVSQLETDLERAQVAIRNASPHYAALAQPQPLKLKEIQAQLDADTLLLEYSLGEERSYLWAITRDSLASYELPKGELIEKDARQVYQLLTARSMRERGETAQQRQERVTQAEAKLPAAARSLSQTLLAPVAAELGNKRLVIVADGALQYIPFAMLPDPSVVSRQLSVAKNNVQRTTDDGQPLIVGHEVVSLPSASALAIQRAELAGRQPAPKMLAVIADPVFDRADERFKTLATDAGDLAQTHTVADNDARSIEHLAEQADDKAGGTIHRLVIPRLPFTHMEATRLLALAPKGSSLGATDFRASRATVLGGDLGQYRYLHFATHGWLDSERPGLSSLVLSTIDEQGRPQDGFLRVNDIYNLRLPAELVVLSACQTGLGQEIKGEGLIGLTRGFMYAGAPRVVVSLWNVNDRATADLMTKFYEKMLKQGERPAAALRAAQVEMWRQKQWQSPYYWAAFTLQGEWR
jgi:CHAT domain-containing protein/tetratricopeptide (TPR) repeat protein